MPARDGDRYTLAIKGSSQTLQVETVVSPAATAKGLSGRPALPPGHGMFFVFEDLARQGMWMPDMRFPLDIVWLDETLTVSHITYNAPPCPSRAKCPTHSSVRKAKYAIELTAGQAAALGLQAGSHLSVKR